MIPGGFTQFNPQLHPRAPGGKFAAKGTGTTASSGTPRQGTGRRGTASRRRGSAVPPNGLGYSAKQWAQLRQLAAMARAGKKLDAHQLHLLHQAHQRRLNVLAGKSAVPKPRKTATGKRAAMPKAQRTAVRKAKARTSTPRVVSGRRAPKVTGAQVNALRAAGYR